MATPATPETSPSAALRDTLVLNHRAATIAPKIGAKELNSDSRDAGSDFAAKAKSRNGTAELIAPTIE